MKALFVKLHTKLGDLWWYSLMIFIACRSGDSIQAVIGLWLVPKYVGTDQLGAVLPLQSLSGFFAAPLAVLATVFAKYVNTYATRGEMGKVKSFISDTLATVCLLFIGCIAFAFIAAPFFYERLRLTDGLLTLLILATGLVTNIFQVFNNALQGLKKFNTITVINFIGAPIRLLTLILFMPFRALSGYTLGQATPPAFSSLIAIFSLRTELQNVKRERTWTSDIPEMIRYAIPIAFWTIGCIIYSTLYSTLLRQRLPETESAAYYMLSKFAEIGGFLGMSLTVVLFPMASEAHEKGQEKKTFVTHTAYATIGFSLLLSLAFWILNDTLLARLPTWAPYSEYSHLLPPATVSMGISCATGAFVTYEMACRRFRPIWLILSMNALWLLFLVAFMGYSYFDGILPPTLIALMEACNVATLGFITWGGLVYTTMQFAIVSALSAMPVSNKPS